MFPTKSTYDYMNEMNRLFPRNTENDIYQLPPTMQIPNLSSPFRQSTPVNHSSSSADSLSPDSFPDMSHRSDTDRPAFESPYIVRRQRPIVGRKIFDKPDCMPPTLKPTMKMYEHDIEFPNSIWQPDEPHLFPPTPPTIGVEQKNYTQNVFYELFSAEKREFEFKPPVSTLSPISSYGQASPRFSPTLPSTPTSVKFGPTHMPPTLPFKMPSQPNFGPTSSRHQEIKPSKMCTFCRKNGETPSVYMTHNVRENVGNKNIVSCPILRSHVCSTCGAFGDNAHTITYCPVLRSNNNGRPLQSTTITLKNTRIKSNGRRRY
uniref:Nanos-type domain-containing protein n=1 Tax=Heliothis virescens TaxID=7102 RepID=A0A2A4K9K4_HELVI